MKLSLFVALVSIGFVAGDGWKKNFEYEYKLVEKTWFKSSGSKEQGTIASIGLNIRPQSENVLIGRITQASLNYADEEDTGRDTTATRYDGNNKSILGSVPLNKPFKIYLKHGAVESLAIEPNSMTDDQIKQLKFIASQLQIDALAENLIGDRSNYHLHDARTKNAYYHTMEPTVFGLCETVYEISPLPEYLSYPQYDTILSLPKYATGEDVIEIVKNTNYKKCNDRPQYLFNLAEQNDNSEQDVMLNTRIIVSGNLANYIIHSSVATEKVGGLSKYVYLTLESMERINADSKDAPRTGDNMQSIGNLVYKENTNSNTIDRV